MNPNITGLVASYLRVNDLTHFFETNGLNFKMRFNYDASVNRMTVDSLCDLCAKFPNIVLGGVNVKLRGKNSLKWLKARRMKGVTMHYCVRKNLSSCGKYLRKLDLSGSIRLNKFEGLGYCVNLRELCLAGTSLYDLDVLSALQGDRLEKLDVSGCRVKDLGALRNFIGLRCLSVGGCRGIVSVEPLGGCLGLECVDLSGLDLLSEVEALGRCVRLRKVRMVGCRSISSVDALVKCVGLRVLDVSGCSGLDNVSRLCECKNIRSFSCVGSDVTDVGDLMCWRFLKVFKTNFDESVLRFVEYGGMRLRSLVLNDLYSYSWNCTCVRLGGLEGLEGLEELELCNMKMCSGFVGAERLRKLVLNNMGRCVWLNRCVELEELKMISMRFDGESIGNLVRLNKLSMIDCKESWKFFDGVNRGFDKLYDVGMEGCDLMKYDFLTKCPELRNLKLSCWPDAGILGMCTKLVSLYFHSIKYHRFEELGMCKNLEVLIFNNFIINDINKMTRCDKLREFWFHHMYPYDQIDMKILSKKCPNLEVIRVPTHWVSMIAKKFGGGIDVCGFDDDAKN